MCRVCFWCALGVLGLLLVCREIAKIIKSVMAITELKKIAKKRCKLLKLLELLGFALVSFGCCFGLSLGFVVGSLKHYRLTYPTARDSTRAIFRDYLAWWLVGCRDLLGAFMFV